MSTTQFKFSSALAAGIMLVIGAGTIIAVGQDPTNKTNRTGKDEPKATVKKREAIKLKDGRFTLFPELFNTDPKKQLQELAAQLNKIGFQDEEKLNGGTDRIRIEQLHHTVKSLLYNIMILESDAWDVTFLNQFHIDVDQFYKTANQIPFSKQELIPFAKIQLVARIAVENLVIERVNVAGSLRKQQLHETIAKRYQSELDLVELENAQRK